MADVEVVVASEQNPTTTIQLGLPKELPNIEGTLKKLAAALTVLNVSSNEKFCRPQS